MSKDISAKLDAIKADLGNKDAAKRVDALKSYATLCGSMTVETEPFVAAALPMVLEAYADKDKAVRETADEAGKALYAKLNPNALGFTLPLLFEAMKNPKWQGKLGPLNLLNGTADKFATAVKYNLPEIVPKVSECMGEVRHEVVQAATDCMSSMCTQVKNKDLDHAIPAVISAIARPTEVPECVHLVSSTTFVQPVEPPALAIMVPVLARGLVEGLTAIKRKAAVVIENMCKMVEVPEHAAPFLPVLLPLLERAAEEVADPECRSVANRAAVVLKRAAGDGKVSAGDGKTDPADVLAGLKELAGNVPASHETIAAFAAHICTLLIQSKNFAAEEWQSAAVPYLSAIPGVKAKDVVEAYRQKAEQVEKAKQEVEEVEEGEPVCDCEFTLGYGGKILLNQAKLKLIRGRRYGLCGANGAGKSTLMKAIAAGQVTGFPSPDEVRTVYVEHDIQADLADLCVVDYIFADERISKALKENGTDRKEVEDVLASVGFNEVMRKAAITSLSGGWKMKLALARAMLMKADIFLLDEPTNHLDVHNVAWLVNYLCNLTNVTSMIVSHDSGFLDKVCTDIIHYENLKLKRYRGNLSAFVKVKPEAAAYYSLEATQFKWVFPEPGYLPGVKAKERAIFKMKDASFRYPGTERWIVQGVSIYLSLRSRVAVLGPNGAGKSTMIKLLVGELEPIAGEVWKHPNMRYAYVAQHAFHHLEQHLDMTPNEYILWRYSTGIDKEAAGKVNKVITEEEEKQMAEPFVIEGVKKVVDRILSRRETRGMFEYEVCFKNRPADDTYWFGKDKLMERGFAKILEQADEKEAARKAGLYMRPLTKANVEKHLADFGLEPEFGTHSRVRGLSGGQKVKTVLGAAMWCQPHILVLDEPTNYLDRDSIGALAAALKDFGGGVVMITHNGEFSDAICTEKWTVNEGKLIAEGTPDEFANQEKVEWKAPEEVTDALGNTVKVKKELTKKEKKQKDRIKKLRKARGEDVSDDDEDWE